MIIAGAGPAGSLVAGLLARAGAGVLIVDRARWPRDKVCGGCLAPAGAACLQRHGVPISESLDLPEMRLMLAGRRWVVPTPGFRGVRRRDFDDALLAWALRGGAEARLGERASFHAPGAARLAGGDPLEASVCIAADGLSGTSLAYDPGFAWEVRPQSRVGVGAVVDAAAMPDVRGLTMYVGAAGYVGLAPLPGGMVDIAAAIDPGAITHGPADVLAGIVAEAGGDPGGLGACALRGVPALWRRRQRVEAPGVFAVGDACGYVEPFTGEGLTWALLGAELLTPMVMQSLEGRYHAGGWTKAVAGLLRRPWRACGAVATLLRRPEPLAALADLAGEFPALGTLATLAHRLLRGPTLVP